MSYILKFIFSFLFRKQHLLLFFLLWDKVSLCSPRGPQPWTAYCLSMWSTDRLQERDTGLIYNSLMSCIVLYVFLYIVHVPKNLLFMALGCTFLCNFILFGNLIVELVVYISPGFSLSNIPLYWNIFSGLMVFLLLSEDFSEWLISDFNENVPDAFHLSLSAPGLQGEFQAIYVYFPSMA